MDSLLFADYLLYFDECIIIIEYHNFSYFSLIIRLLRDYSWGILTC